MILCPNCGANPRFDIASQKMLCPYCGTYSEPTDDVYAGKDGADTQTVTGDYAGQPDMMQVKIYTCAQCGAELMSTDTDATAFCSYCGTHQVLQERLDVKKRPDHIIPFKITKDQCKTIYKKKLSKMIFAPRALKDPQYIDEFRGIYMPYWFYNFRQSGRMILDGKKEHRKGDYRIIDHFDLGVDVDNSYAGLSHDSSSSFEDKISESLAPYNTNDTLPFRTAYLSGFYADIPDTESGTYKHEAELIAAEETFDEVTSIPAFRSYDLGDITDEQKVRKTHTKLDSVTNAMFPVWFLSYRKNDRVAYAAINGQTGKLTADIPIDGRKYLLCTAIVTIILWILLEMFNISSLRGILMTVMAVAFAGWLVFAMIIDRLRAEKKNREWEKRQAERAAKKTVSNEEKETGKKSKKKNKDDLPKDKASMLGLGGIILIYIIIVAVCGFMIWLEYGAVMLAVPLVMAVYCNTIIGSVHEKRGIISNWALAVAMEFSIVIWLINPYKDPLYYAGCLLMTACVIWCYFDVLYFYNQLMTRPLPQFNKHGGDDRA